MNYIMSMKIQQLSYFRDIYVLSWPDIYWSAHANQLASSMLSLNTLPHDLIAQPTTNYELPVQAESAKSFASCTANWAN